MKKQLPLVLTITFRVVDTNNVMTTLNYMSIVIQVWQADNPTVTLPWRVSDKNKQVPKKSLPSHAKIASIIVERNLYKNLCTTSSHFSFPPQQKWEVSCPFKLIAPEIFEVSDNATLIEFKWICMINLDKTCFSKTLWQNSLIYSISTIDSHLLQRMNFSVQMHFDWLTR